MHDPTMERRLSTKTVYPNPHPMLASAIRAHARAANEAMAAADAASRASAQGPRPGPGHDAPPPPPHGRRSRFPFLRLGGFLGGRPTTGHTAVSLTTSTAGPPESAAALPAPATPPPHRHAWFERLRAGCGPAERGDELEARVERWSVAVTEHAAPSLPPTDAKPRGDRRCPRGCFARRRRTVDSDDSGYDADAETVVRSEGSLGKDGEEKAGKTSWWGRVCRGTRWWWDLLYGEEWARMQSRIG